ncbi:MAG: preprotein translocase subunit SecE [Firmicutes bacterium]|nr:preprotein translocase subunit SecE [Bacillota bacterium]
MAARKKPGKLREFGGRIGKFFREVRTELKKVLWPSRSEVIFNTGVVLVTVALVSISIWVIDSVVTQLLRLIIVR